MANSPYCDPEDLVRNAKACYDEEGAGIYHLALIDRAAVIDRSTPETYMTTLLAAEAACQAFILRNIYGNYDGGTSQFGKSYGGGTPKRIGSEHTLTVADPQYVGNENFWNAMQNQAQRYVMDFFSQTRGWPVDKVITVDAKGIIVEDFKEVIEGQIILKWNDKNNPVSYPANVADLAIFPELLLGTPVSNGDETYTAGTHTITVAATGELDILIPFVNAVSYSIPNASELSALTAAGATVESTDTGLRVSGAIGAIDLGTYVFTVEGANTCGVSGSQQFTLTVTA